MSSSSGPNIITKGLILHLDAADKRSYPGTGTVWTDRSGKGYNGTLINGPTFNSGNGGSIVFDGVNDYVSTNLVYNLPSGSTEFSCGCWFKCGPQNNNNILVSNYNNAPNPFNLYVNSDGTVMGFSRNSSNVSVSVNSTSTYVDNNYHNLFYLKNSSNNYYIYVDGVLQNSATANLGSINPNNNIWIGALRLFNQGYFNGNIAQVSIYNKALSTQEVKQNFNATKSRFGLI